MMLLQLLLVGGMVTAKGNDVLTHHFEFKSLNEQQYLIVNDSVMGGRSVSKLEISQESATYKGKVSLKNNGGFASVRMIWPFSDISSGEFIKLKVMGDGRTYQLRLRADSGFDGVAYTQSFKTTANEVEYFRFDVNQFVPTYRGRILRNMPKLKLENVKQLGIMVADKQVGDFELSLFDIGVGVQN